MQLLLTLASRRDLSVLPLDKILLNLPVSGMYFDGLWGSV